MDGEVGINLPIPTVVKTIVDFEGRKQEIKEINLIEVKTQKSGESFGELSLLENKARSATVICKTDSHFAILDKTNYDRILSKKS